ncbi:GNAT family N-acetyltransferase [Rhodoferax mekongensis]|uniref:GNAT family N-acetyltransferase n=1 Tax=Rhodoferax mekongensis TaxID=3068341 RepID=A0ABZ0B062_9BURK|nr:GNAT family N-acetyltransferase [Rhodoferax sp. TBRC 17307]WNO05127.1 GNAT family N-acetyltransferase [Rhodoferax sp. TBRC 17307]
MSSLLPIPKILPAETAIELDAVRALFQEYAGQLGVDLCFQNFAAELSGLPGDYEANRGCLLLAEVNGAWAGCCALRPLDTTDYPNAAEMKRLYVRPDFRRLGIGRMLAEAIMDAARARGYDCILLDTLDDMETARALYAELGFEEVPPYYFNPIAGAHYLKAEL